MINGRLQLLIVEDEAAHVEAIRRAFEQAGAQADIQCVGTLREYREQIARQPPDFALVDLNLPDGRATEILTHPPADGSFPILVMTAFGAQQIVVEVMKAGALDYVVKSPEAFTAMPQTVARALREWRLLQKQKQVEAALREKEHFLSESQRISQVGGWFWNLTGPIQWTEETYRIYGVAPETFTPAVESLVNLVHPADRPALLEWVRACCAGEKPAELEYRALRPDGSIRFLSGRGDLVYDAGNKPAHVMGTVQDITERKQAEAALTSQQMLLSTLVEHLPVAVYLKDASGRKTLSNPVDMQNCGVTSPADILGKTDAQLFQREQAAVFYAEEQNVFKTGQPMLNREEQLPGPDGSIRWLLTSKVPLFDDGGRVAGLVGIGLDITQRKREELLLEFNAQEGWSGSHEGFFARLVELIGRTLNVDYAFIGRLKDPQTVQTTGLYAKGKIAPDIEYSTRGAPCHDVVGKMLCYHGEKLQELFPNDALLVEMGAQSYLGIPLMDSARKPLGLIAVLDTKPMPDARLATTLLQIAAVRVAGEMERKRAEEALQFNNALLSTQQEASIDGILVVDENARILSYNRRFTEMWRLPADLVEDNADEEILQFVRAQVRDGEPFLQRVQYLYEHREETSEEELILADGRIFDRYSAPMFGPEKRYYGRVWYFRDITARKRAEASHARLAMATEQAAETVVITDTDANILYVNPAFEKTSGYTSAEVVGQNPRILKSFKQDAGFYRQMWEVLFSGETWRGHITNRRKDGMIYEEEATISPVRDGTGKIVNYVAVKRDVTHEIQLESRMRQAEKMQAIGTLAGGIAHDFNNILAAMFGFSYLLQQDTAGNAAAQEDIREILKSANRAKDLVQQILTFSRQSEQKRQVIRLDTAVKEAAKILRSSLPASIKMDLNLAADAPAVLADPTQIYQVTLNLAVNAQHAMEGQSGTLRILLGSFQPDETFLKLHPEFQPICYARLTVADTGHGIDGKTLKRIFDPFFTTKPAGKGTGLGLAVVHGIIHSHDGHVTVESEVGRGTTFQLYFPAQTEVPVLTETAAEDSPCGQGQRVLVVDDEVALTSMLKRLLEHKNYQVTCCNHALTAVELIGKCPAAFDLVITDLTMPELNGMELARQIHGVRADLPVILLSGFAPELIPEKLQEIGIVELLQKPVSRSALAGAVHRALAGPAVSSPASKTS